MNFKVNFLKIIARTSFLLSISLITFSSLIYLYSQRGLLIKYLYPQYRADENIDESSKDRSIAKKIMKGGYILHFRHAERDKWIDVQMYDSLESDIHKNGKNESRYAEKDYFKKAVCLNNRGLIQAKAIGEHLKNIQLPIGNVISSPSCRSRQTADIAFGGYEKMDRDLVHVGPYSEKKEQRTIKLIDLYSKLPVFEGTNTIVSSHNGVIHSEMFENNNDPNLYLEEGGFYVISNKDGKLLLEHEYNNFNNFIKLFYKR